MDPERRHQVFVSSTYKDLQEERKAVTLTLLEHNCIPVGMELFPAGAFDPWEVIKGVIAQSDYYLVIVAGKYGSCPFRSRYSYTEREFRHAAELDKPIVVFLREGIDSLPANLTETSSENRERLNKFIALTKRRNLVKQWRDTGGLAAHVASSINSLRVTAPRPGWIRADAYANHAPLQEQIDQIKRELCSRSKDVHRDFAPRFDNHAAAQNEMKAVIDTIAKSNDVIRLRVMGVSLAYSWPFLESIIAVTSKKRRPRVDIELAITSPAHLAKKGLSTWSKKAKATLTAIHNFAARNSSVKNNGTRIVVAQYDNLPHWHGMLINDSVLFLGRSNWQFDELGGPPELFVGQTTYRLFYFDDLLGGADRIALFGNWFRYYKTSSSKVTEYGGLAAG